MAKRPPPRGRRPKPFKLYDMPFKTQGDFDREVRTRAQAVYQPKLQDINRNIQTEGRKSQGKVQDIQQFGAGWSDELNKAFAQASNALTGLATANAPNDQARETLRAALGASTGRVNDEAARLGGAPQPLSQASETAGLQGATAGNNYLSGLAMNILGGENQFRNTVPRALETQQLGREDQRHSAALQDLTGQRSDVVGQIGGLRAQARGDLMKELLAKRGQKFQEQLANKEFGLKKQGFNLQAELGRGDLAVRRSGARQVKAEFDWKKYIDQQQLDQTQQQLDAAADQAAGQADEADRSAVAQLYARGAAAVDSFLAPNAADMQEFRKNLHGRKRTVKEKSDQLYRRNRKPEQLYASLKRIGLPTDLILKLMGTVRIPGFTEYVRLKKGLPGGKAQGRIRRGN